MAATLGIPGNARVQITAFSQTIVTNTGVLFGLFIAPPGVAVSTLQSSRNELGGFGTSNCGSQFATVPMAWDLTAPPSGQYTFEVVFRNSSGGSSASLVGTATGSVVSVLRVTVL